MILKTKKRKEKQSLLELDLLSSFHLIFSPYLQQNTSKELYIHTDSFPSHSTLSSTTPIGLLSLSQSPQQDSLMSPITSILPEPESFCHAHLIQILPNIWLNWSHPPFLVMVSSLSFQGNCIYPVFSLSSPESRNWHLLLWNIFKCYCTPRIWRICPWPSTFSP